jgi:hypothetical protein
VAKHDNIFKAQCGDDRIDVITDFGRSVSVRLNPVAFPMTAQVQSQTARVTTQQVPSQVEGVGMESTSVQHQ